MRKGFWLVGATVVALGSVACDGSSEWGAGNPPGGGPHTGGPMQDVPDATPGLDSGADPNVITGQICRVDNITLPGACTPQRTAGLKITVEKTTGEMITSTTTDSSGKWQVAKPALDRVAFVVSDSQSSFHKSAQILILVGQGAVDTQIPVITEAYFTAIVTSTLVTPATDTGMVVTHLRKVDAGYSGVTLGPLRGVTAYYDVAGDPNMLTPVGPTTGLGIGVWFNVLPAPSATYQVTKASDNLSVARDAYAFPDAITFLDEQF